MAIGWELPGVGGARGWELGTSSAPTGTPWTAPAPQPPSTPPAQDRPPMGWEYPRSGGVRGWELPPDPAPTGQGWTAPTPSARAPMDWEFPRTGGGLGWGLSATPASSDPLAQGWAALARSRAMTPDMLQAITLLTQLMARRGSAPSGSTPPAPR